MAGARSNLSEAPDRRCCVASPRRDRHLVAVADVADLETDLRSHPHSLLSGRKVLERHDQLPGLATEALESAVTPKPPATSRACSWCRAWTIAAAAMARMRLPTWPRWKTGSNAATRRRPCAACRPSPGAPLDFFAANLLRVAPEWFEFTRPHPAWPGQRTHAALVGAARRAAFGGRTEHRLDALFTAVVEQRIVLRGQVIRHRDGAVALAAEHQLFVATGLQVVQRPTDGPGPPPGRTCSGGPPGKLMTCSVTPGGGPRGVLAAARAVAAANADPVATPNPVRSPAAT